MSLGAGDLVVMVAIAVAVVLHAYIRGFRRGVRVGVDRANADNAEGFRVEEDVH